jgi:hypothetical protein
MFSLLLFAFVTFTPGSSPVSVVQCGADPSGVADSTKAFENCLRAVPAGDILVPTGTYKITQTIVKNRNQNLVGAGSATSKLLCEMTTTPCVVVADISGGVNNYNASKIQDLTIEGPGVSNTSIGVYMGGDPLSRFSASNAYADGANMVDVRVTGFNHGVEWGNNAWGNKLVRTLVFGNSTGLYVPEGVTNSGENIGLTDTSVFNNGGFGIDDHGNFEWMISGSAFDYNGTAVEFFGASFHAINCHFEQSGGQVIFQPYGSGNLSIKDSEIIVQSNTGSDSYVINTWPQALNVSFENLSVWSNHPIQYFMHVQGTMSGTISDLYGNGNKMIGSLSNAVSKATVSGSSAF